MKPEHIVGLESRSIPSVRFLDVPPLTIEPSEADGTWYRDAGKRSLDILITLLLALLIVPLLLPLIALIMLDGHSPFYTQERVGRGGKLYRMWKLRSMVPNADAILEAYLEANPVARAEWDVHQKLKNDPRVTWIGKLLRTYSLDELPQFWNVLIGDMSIVGPRPMMPKQTALYTGRSYYALRPGITGPWQVSDRHASSFADRVRFDDVYKQTMSLGTDLRLIVCTVGVVLIGSGC